ncbi:MAG: tetratricopeptide repeat protein, partial [Bacteroidota bacterium]|nr:tetratricopeptide repeat protein [Bacteroidota bacterium]
MLFPSLFFGNNYSTKIDSLKTVIDHAKHDTDRVKAYKKWDDLIYISDPNLDLILNQKLDSICRINLQKNLLPKEKQFFKLYRGIANTNFGIISRMNGNLDKAFNHYLLSSSIYRDLHREMEEGRSYNYLGILLCQSGNEREAMVYC